MKNKEVLWGYFSQFLQYGAALLVLPIVLRYLDSKELGIWYIFMTIAAFVAMLDMGFAQTLARNVSYVMGGAKKLIKEGVQKVDSTDVDYALLNAVIASSKKIFFYVSGISFLLLGTFGTWYIHSIVSAGVDIFKVFVAWGVFVFAVTVNIYYKYYTPLLQGRSLFTEYYKANTYSNLSFVLFAAFFLLKGAGLIGLSLSYLISGIIGRYLSWKYSNDPDFSKKLKQIPDSSISFKELFSTMWHNSYKLGLGIIGSFLILRANTFIASIYLGLEITASYSLTLQVFSVLQSMAMVTFVIKQPKLSQFRVSNDSVEFFRTTSISLTTSLLLFSILFLIVLLVGQDLLDIIKSKTKLLSFPFLILMGFTIFLELNHSMAAGIIVTGNSVPFVKPALISGVAIIICSLLLVKFTSTGIAALLFSQFLVQLFYNNWKWPLELARELNSTYTKILYFGFSQISPLRR